MNINVFFFLIGPRKPHSLEQENAAPKQKLARLNGNNNHVDF